MQRFTLRDVDKRNQNTSQSPGSVYIAWFNAWKYVDIFDMVTICFQTEGLIKYYMYIGSW